MQASASAVLFELRARLVAGTLESASGMKIDTKLSVVVNAIIQNHEERMSDSDSVLLTNAYKLRNKVLHCEFSAARKMLPSTTDSGSEPGVIRVSGITPENAITTLDKIKSGDNVGQRPVASEPTKTHGDLFGWLLETQQAGDFAASKVVFEAGIAVLDKFVNSQTGT